jgi:aquaporin Z
MSFSYVKIVRVNEMKLSLSIRHFMAETYGTFVVVFLATVTYVVIQPTNPLVALMLSATAYGASYIAMHYTLSHISGAQFNPIVTLASWMDRRISAQTAWINVAAQVAGGITAGAMTVWITRVIPGIRYDVLGYQILSPFDTPVAVALVLEMFGSFFIVYVYLAVSRRRLAAWTGVSVGLMMMLVVVATGWLTGGHANPARSIGTLLFLQAAGLEQIWVYLVGPALGAAFASLFYTHLKYEDDHDVA